MANVDLLASCWTHAGEAAPQRPDERSPFDLLDRIAAVGASGWAGIGLLHADLVEARGSVGYPAVRAAIEAAGLRHVEVEFLGDWWEGGEARTASDLVRADLFEATEALGARTIKAAGKMFSTDVDLDVMRAAWDDLATQAAERGARVALEALPFTNFATIGQGSDFLTSVGNPNGGLIIDIWHVYRGGNTPDDLLTQVNPDVLFAVELNDAAAAMPAPDDMWSDTIDRRRLPGEGEWDVPGFINVMRRLGFDGPWGVEILSAEHRAKPLDAEVRDAYAATMTQFELADRLA